MSDWLRRLRKHPGLPYLVVLCPSAVIAADGGWLGWAVAALWCVPVVLTNRQKGATDE